jgi:hypothetical protein
MILQFFNKTNSFWDAQHNLLLLYIGMVFMPDCNGASIPEAALRHCWMRVGEILTYSPFGLMGF